MNPSYTLVDASAFWRAQKRRWESKRRRQHENCPPPKVTKQIRGLREKQRIYVIELAVLEKSLLELPDAEVKPS